MSTNIQNNLDRTAATVHELAREVERAEKELAAGGMLARARTRDEVVADAISGTDKMELAAQRQGDPALAGLAGKKAALAQGVDALNTALEAYNAAAAQNGGAQLDVHAALQQMVERSREAMQVVSPAMPARAAFDVGASILIRGIMEDRWHGVHKIFPQLPQMVQGEARKRGLDVVTPKDVQAILVDLADPAKNQEVWSRALRLANDPRDGHGFVRTDMVDEAKRKAGRGDWRAIDDASRRADNWIEGMARQQLAGMRAYVGGPELILGALARASHDDPGAAELWRAALLEQLRDTKALAGEARAAALKVIEKNVAEIAGQADYGAAFARATAGDNAALDQLAELVRRSEAPSRRATVSAQANASVKQIAIEIPPPATLFHWSGNFNFGINHRNMQGASNGFMESVRTSALYASRENRPVRVLEVTNGLPVMAVEFTDPGGVRRHGDFLECAYDPDDPRTRQGSGYGARLLKFDTKRIEGHVVTGHDLLGDYLAGKAPQDVRSYFDDLIGGPLTRGRQDYHRKPSLEEMRAGREALERAGKLNVYSGGDPIDRLRALAREGKKFDAVVCHELSWTPDRINMLEAIQHVLEPNGKAFISLEWWSPLGGEGEGTRSNAHLADTVRGGLLGGEQKLAEYLAKKFPAAFEIAHFPGAPTLIIKGTRDPVRLPEMTAAATGETVRMDMPVIRWST